MAPRVTYRRRLSYNTKSNKIRKVRTPGRKLVVQYIKKKPSKPKCGDCGDQLRGIKPCRPYELKRLSKTKKSVTRAYGGSKCGGCVRRKILRSFLAQERDIAKKITKELQEK